MGMQRSIELDGSEIKICESTVPMSLASVISRMTPTHSQWRNFRVTLDNLRVWEWRPKYEEPGVLDGASWRFIVTYADRQIESGGVNCYPSHGGTPDPSASGSTAFEILCDAVSELTDGFAITEP